MPHSNQSIQVSSEYQTFLNRLDLHVSNGKSLKWDRVRNAYKNRSLIVHPDKGGSENLFIQLTEAYEYMTAVFNKEQELQQSYKDILSTFKTARMQQEASFDDIKTSCDKMHNNISSSSDNLHTSISECHVRLRADIEADWNKMLYNAACSLGPTFGVLAVAIVAVATTETKGELDIAFWLIIGALSLTGYGAYNFLQNSPTTGLPGVLP